MSESIEVVRYNVVADDEMMAGLKLYEHLTALGEDGWELVAVTPKGWVFKKFETVDGEMPAAKNCGACVNFQMQRAVGNGVVTGQCGRDGSSTNSLAGCEKFEAGGAR